MSEQDTELQLRKWKIVTFALAGVAVVLAVLLTIMYLSGPRQAQTYLEPRPGLEITAEDLALLGETNKAFVAVSEFAGPSVVQIRTLTRYERSDFFWPFGDDFFRDFFGPFDGFGGEQWHEAAGSGVIVSADGFILTNNHVVDEAKTITVALTDGREFDAEVVGVDPATDLAVIRIDPGSGELPVALLGNSDSLLVGDWVVALGSPFGLQNTVTAGIISAKGRSALNILDYEDFIQTDAAINPGNSGGALVNLKGEVIGINTAIFSTSGGYMGIGLAIPINLARHVMEQLIDTGEVVRGWIGVYIQDVTRELARALELPEETRGALVGEVIEGTPAAEGGLRSGDVIIAVDGETVATSAELRNRVARFKPGERVAFDVLRDRLVKTVTITIGERPVEEMPLAGRERAPGGGAQGEALGVQVGELTAAVAEELGYTGRRGILVTDVDRDSSAFRRGVRPGMIIVEVNRTPIDNPALFAEIVERSDSPVLLYVWSRGAMTYLALEKD